MQLTEFKDLKLKKELQDSIETLGFKEMTEIQQRSLPHVLDGIDVIGEAQTGSGKTIAFGLCVLSKIDLSNSNPQALVLCPTRELANQVAIEFKKLARLIDNLKILTLCGGTPISPQVLSLEHGAHIIVGTPGRVLDHLTRKTLFLSRVNTLVLDEADRMLEMGFSDDIRAIIRKLPRDRQSLLFSATFPNNIKELSEDILRDPVHVKVDTLEKSSQIEQIFIETEKENKIDVLVSALHLYRPTSTIVFCSTKVQCQEICDYLWDNGVSAIAINGDLLQAERNEVMVRFANGSVSVLVATDVAARGIDIDHLGAVVNFDLSKDPEIHVHRIGRTGRAGKKGLAISLYRNTEERKISEIESYMNVTVKRTNLADKNIERKSKLLPEMKTLKISGGKKNKLRAGDILGALTKQIGIEGKYIGKINIFDFHSFVAIHKNHAERAERELSASKIKNRTFKIKIFK